MSESNAEPKTLQPNTDGPSGVLAMLTRQAISLSERGLLPDAVLRAGIRSLMRERLHEIHAADPAAAAADCDAFVEALRGADVALLTDKANEQHYEVPAEFFGGVLGPHRKYSSCWWPSGVETLESAEAASLAATCERAELVDGQQILELGCGWGSLSLYMAAHYPQSRVTSVSNSHSQRAYIEAEALRRGLSNLRVITCDMNVFQIDERFDRVVSVGMLEHVGAAYFEGYFRQVARLLKKNGVALIHVIGRPEGPGVTNPWIAKYIFPGGYIPSLSELARAIERAGLLVTDVEVLRVHYADTLKAWRERFTARRAEALAMYDERFCRMWDFYLAGSEACFRLGQQSVFQIQLAHDVNAIPLTRAYIPEREARLQDREMREQLRTPGE